MINIVNLELLIHDLFWFYPCADSKDLIEIQGDLALLNKTLNLWLDSCRQDSHQSLGGESVLGSLLVVTLRHVGEHLVGSLVNVMDDLSKISFEISGSKILQVGKSCWWNISFPLKVSFSFINHSIQVGIVSAELDK